MTSPAAILCTTASSKARMGAGCCMLLQLGPAFARVVCGGVPRSCLLLRLPRSHVGAFLLMLQASSAPQTALAPDPDWFVLKAAQTGLKTLRYGVPRVGTVISRGSALHKCRGGQLLGNFAEGGSRGGQPRTRVAAAAHSQQGPATASWFGEDGLCGGITAVAQPRG